MPSSMLDPQSSLVSDRGFAKPPAPATRSFAPLLLLLCGVTLGITTFTGCGYMVGNSSHPDVRSVYVPMFTSTVFRRDLEFQLTEAVQKQITARTPYRLVQGPEADTRLVGRIVGADKVVLGETQFDDPRELQFNLICEVSWEDTRTGQVLCQQQIPVPADIIPLAAQASFAPEVGHSLATAKNDALQRMATRIVDMMEAPW